MEQIGLIAKYLLRLNEDCSNHKLVQSSMEQKVYTDGLLQTLVTIKHIAACEDITIIIDAELTILNYELEFYANSYEETNSINKALEQIKEARPLIRLVKDTVQYKATATSYASKHKESGLPLDAFRMFIKSHTARLTNRLTAPLSVVEKNILRQRKANLQIAKAMYIELQNMALGIV